MYALSRSVQESHKKMFKENLYANEVLGKSEFNHPDYINQ